MLAMDLSGSLPCARCRYDLRGLSVMGSCPECNLPVRATLLVRVDPRADELQPLPRPRLVVAGLAVWSGAAFAAALVVWSLRWFGPTWGEPGRMFAPMLAVLLASLSGVGSLVLVKPHREVVSRSGLFWAVSATVGHVILAWVLWRLLVEHDASDLRSGLDWASRGTVERLWLCIASQAIIVWIASAIRVNARLLWKRHKLMRTGRADRQTLAAIVVVASIGALGNAVRLTADAWRPSAAAIADQIGQLIVVVSSVLLTLGLAGVVVDTVRLCAVLLEPPLTLGQLLRNDETTRKEAHAGEDLRSRT